MIIGLQEETYRPNRQVVIVTLKYIVFYALIAMEFPLNIKALIEKAL